MAAEHNHVVGKERSRFCDYLRKGVLAFLFLKTKVLIRVRR
jgi:hypothetical protein